MKPPSDYEAPPMAQTGNKKVWPWIVAAAAGITCTGCLLVFAAVLFPVFAQAKNAAVNQICMTRLRQQSLAFLIYANDNDDRFPSDTQWMDTIKPDLVLRKKGPFGGSRTPESILHCPSLPSDQYGYAMSSELSKSLTTKLKSPQSVPLVFDSVQTKRNAVSKKPDFPTPGRHNGGDNVAYADGHSKHLKGPEIGGSPSGTSTSASD